MTRLFRSRSWPGWALLPVVAATLACSLASGGGAPASLGLTQAAATVTAAAAQAATLLAGVQTPATTATPAPTELVVDTLTSTARATGTPMAAKRPTSTPTPAAGATGTPTPASSGQVKLDPCSLMSQAEAEGLLGAKAGKPTLQNGACFFSEAKTRLTVVDVFAFPAAQAQPTFDAHAFLLQGFHVKIDPAALTKLQADSAAGDMVAALSDLANMAIGHGNYRAEKVDGLGSVALWSWNLVNTRYQAYLLAAKPGALVGIEFVLGASGQEAGTKQAATVIVRRILNGLPANFTVSGAP